MRNQRIGTVQSEHVPGGIDILRKAELPKNTREIGRSRRHIVIWANGTDFSSGENDKPHCFVRLEFFNGFKVKIANIEANRTHFDDVVILYRPQQQGPYINHNGSY